MLLAEIETAVEERLNEPVSTGSKMRSEPEHPYFSVGKEGPALPPRAPLCLPGPRSSPQGPALPPRAPLFPMGSLRAWAS